MREKLVELIRQIVIPFWAGQIADHLISNDVVPVVRCKDCLSFQADEIAAQKTGTCWNCEMVREFDDFCSYGERKDGEG